MPRAKKTHPVDIRNDEMVLKAESFNVTLRLSPTKTFQAPASTLSAALGAYDRLALESKQGRKPLIYALVTENGLEKGYPVSQAFMDQARMGALEIPAPIPATLGAVRGEDGEILPEYQGSEDDDLEVPAPVTAAEANPEMVPAQDPEVENRPRSKREMRAAEKQARREARLAENAARIEVPETADQTPTPAPAKAKAEKTGGKRAAEKAAAEEAARRGEVREPDFSPPSHKPFRKKLAAITEAFEKGDLAFLKAETTEPKSSSRVMLCRYRDLCILALESRSSEQDIAA